MFSLGSPKVLWVPLKIFNLHNLMFVNSREKMKNKGTAPTGTLRGISEQCPKAPVKSVDIFNAPLMLYWHRHCMILHILMPFSKCRSSLFQSIQKVFSTLHFSEIFVALTPVPSCLPSSVFKTFYFSGFFHCCHPS